MLEEHGSSRSTRSSRLARLARQSRTCRVESSRVESSQVEFKPIMCRIGERLDTLPGRRSLADDKNHGRLFHAVNLVDSFIVPYCVFLRS